MLIFPVVCKTRLDLGFVIDASSSLGQKNFERCLKFVERIIESLKIGRGYTRVGVMLYSSNAAVKIRLGQYNYKQDLLKAVRRLR